MHDPSTPGKQRSVELELLPIVGIVLLAFLVTGIGLPVVPLHVNKGLGFGGFVVGLASGAQFVAALLTRFASGRYADERGAKRAVAVGLVLGAVSGLVLLASLRFLAEPTISAVILIAGRAVLGASESFIVTGALGWGLAVAGGPNAGRAMARIGMAMYVAFGIGAPVGSALYAAKGFAAIGIATVVLPLGTLLLVASVRGVAPASRGRASITKVLGAVSWAGLGLALSSFGFSAMLTFVFLLFAHHGWALAWLAFTLFSATFIIGRLFFGHLPDRVGGAKVALICVLVEAAGQAMIGLAPWAAFALAGAAVTGFGYSLVYPGFGVEAVRRAPPENRALAMGAYTAFLDLALGVAGPLLGLVASGFGITAVFFVSTIVVACASIVAMRLLASARASVQRVGIT